MDLKLSVVIGTPDLAEWPYQLFSGTFEEKIQKAADSGFDGVELICRDMDLVDREAVKETLRRYNLECPALNTGPVYGVDGLCLVSPDKEIEQRGMYQLKRFLEFAGEFGALVDIGMLRGKMSIMPDRAAAEEALVGKMHQAAEHAAHCGARIIVEPLNRFESDFVHSAHDGVELAGRVNHPNFGMLVDTFHMNIEDVSIEESVREAAGCCLWHVHVGDSNRLSAGKGHFDFPELIRVLKEVKFKGFLSAEHVALPDPDTAAQETIRYLRPLL